MSASQTFADLVQELIEVSEEGNRFAVKNVIREMASRRGCTSQEMAAAIIRGESPSEVLSSR